MLLHNKTIPSSGATFYCNAKDKSNVLLKRRGLVLFNSTAYCYKINDTL